MLEKPLTQSKKKKVKNHRSKPFSNSQKKMFFICTHQPVNPCFVQECTLKKYIYTEKICRRIANYFQDSVLP